MVEVLKKIWFWYRTNQLLLTIQTFFTIIFVLVVISGIKFPSNQSLESMIVTMIAVEIFIFIIMWFLSFIIGVPLSEAFRWVGRRYSAMNEKEFYQLIVPFGLVFGFLFTIGILEGEIKEFFAINVLHIQISINQAETTLLDSFPAIIPAIFGVTIGLSFYILLIAFFLGLGIHKIIDKLIPKNHEVEASMSKIRKLIKEKNMELQVDNNIGKSFSLSSVLYSFGHLILVATSTLSILLNIVFFYLDNYTKIMLIVLFLILFMFYGFSFIHRYLGREVLLRSINIVAISTETNHKTISGNKMYLFSDKIIDSFEHLKSKMILLQIILSFPLIFQFPVYWNVYFQLPGGLILLISLCFEIYLSGALVFYVHRKNKFEEKRILLMKCLEDENLI